MADVAKTNGLTRIDAEVVVQTVLDSIVEALNSGEKVDGVLVVFVTRKEILARTETQRLVRRCRSLPRKSPILDPARR